ncbi:CU044_5270 family protein [Micromonospora narathiwatensis]|uniref:CU044_5270 family protein n=1 Tax=Micromonospora narathiwatensis TaxID=299146 RepID=A0A1A9A0Y2_9ACTN|nr:CU044_5270 family protein [Micromonospora narathiwatensis]SBT49804.1 hypothetical protein GA0070621_3562 [Micromonospora narathiwatensis]
MTNDDIIALRESWSEVEPPSLEAQNRARAALLDRIAEREATVPNRSEQVTPRGWRLPGWAWRSGFATLGAAALVAGVVAVGGLNQSIPPTRTQPTQQPRNVQGGSIAPIFELAAMHAENESFTPPRAGQWTYVELKIVRPGKIAEHKGQARSETSQSWVRADGRQQAWMSDGKLEITEEAPEARQSMPPQDYAAVAALPTDPQALLDWLRAHVPSSRGDKAQRDVESYGALESMLRDNVLSPRVKATALRALALIPGVTQSTEPVDFNGRPAIAVGMVQDGWRREDILFDPTTHEYLGGRTLVVKDQTLPEGISLTKGDVEVELIRITGKIVDAPGQTS